MRFTTISTGTWSVDLVTLQKEGIIEIITIVVQHMDIFPCFPGTVPSMLKSSVQSSLTSAFTGNNRGASGCQSVLTAPDMTGRILSPAKEEAKGVE